MTSSSPGFQRLVLARRSRSARIPASPLDGVLASQVPRVSVRDRDTDVTSEPLTACRPRKDLRNAARYVAMPPALATKCVRTQSAKVDRRAGETERNLHVTLVQDQPGIEHARAEREREEPEPRLQTSTQQSRLLLARLSTSSSRMPALSHRRATRSVRLKPSVDPRLPRHASPVSIKARNGSTASLRRN